jgi:hypothetical protein
MTMRIDRDLDAGMTHLVADIGERAPAFISRLPKLVKSDPTETGALQKGKEVPGYKIIDIQYRAHFWREDQFALNIVSSPRANVWSSL